MPYLILSYLSYLILSISPYLIHPEPRGGGFYERQRASRARHSPLRAFGSIMQSSPSRAATKFGERATKKGPAANDTLLKAALNARVALNVDDMPLAVEYANGEQGQVFADRDRKVATGAAAKVMQDANIGAGAFKIPKVKGQPSKLEVVGGTRSQPAHQPRCAPPAQLASHARVAPC
jgi:hypothetical protein